MKYLTGSTLTTKTGSLTRKEVHDEFTVAYTAINELLTKYQQLYTTLTFLMKNVPTDETTRSMIKQLAPPDTDLTPQ